MHKKALNFRDNEDEIDGEYSALTQIEDLKSYNPNLFEQGYQHLDRYSDIKPYKHNKIKISTKSQYINASPINIGDKKNYFISTQGPKDVTVEDFWTMVFDYNSKVIVMLCREFESGRKKCENYWEAKLTKFDLKIENTEEKEMHVIRTIKIKKKIK